MKKSGISIGFSGRKKQEETCSEEDFLPLDIDLGSEISYEEIDAMLAAYPLSAEEIEAEQLSTEITEKITHLVDVVRRRKDSDVLNHNLVNSFPTANSMLDASTHMYMLTGFRYIDALLMSNIKNITRCIELDSYGLHPPMGRLSVASGYLASNFYGYKEEYFYLYCINQIGNLKERILLNHGIEEAALLSIRKLMAAVVRYKPKGIVIAHNHPGGTLRPSQEDLDSTLAVMRAVNVLEVPLLDHVIVADQQVVSIRDNGFFPEELWMRQAPNSRLLKYWLSPDPPPSRSRKSRSPKND